MPSNPVIRNISRDRLMAVFRDEDLVRVFEAVMYGVGTTLPEGTQAAQDDASSALQLRPDLANASLSTKGAGLVAFNPSLTYAAGTVGAALSGMALNVKAFPWLAKGDGVTDDTAAIQACLDSIPTGNYNAQRVYFPAGQYRITAGLTAVGKHITMSGDGPRDSLLAVGAGVTAVAFDASGCPAPCVGMSDMGIQESGAQPAMVGITVRNAGDFFLQNVYITTSGKALDIGSSAVDVVFSRLSMVHIECYGAQEAIRFRCGGGKWTNIDCRKFRIAGVTGPAVWITGQSTSLTVTNSSFGGKGTHKSRQITTITNAGATFSVTLASAAYIVGETLLLRGTGTGYDGTWKVSNVVGNVVTLTGTTGLGTISPVAGFLDKPHATVVMDNSTGAVNESLWSNVLFEGIDDGGSAGGIGSVSLLLDATEGNSQMAGHTFTGCMYDTGQVSAWLIGKNMGSGDYLISDLKFNGMTCRYAKYGIYMREVRGIQINQMTGDCIRAQATAAELLGSAAVFIDSAGSQPTIGVNITHSTIGRQASYATGAAQAAFSPDYGIRISGTPQDLKWSNCHIHGLTAPVGTDIAGNVVSTSTRLVDRDCTYNYTAGAESGSTVIPTIASAASIQVLYGQTFTISGTTSISTLTGGWVGRQVSFITTSALTFSTGVNIANALTTVAGQLVLAVYDGASWHLR